MAATKETEIYSGADRIVAYSQVATLRDQGFNARIEQRANGTFHVYRSAKGGNDGEGQDSNREDQEGVSPDEIGRSEGGEEVNAEEAEAVSDPHAAVRIVCSCGSDFQTTEHETTEEAWIRHLENPLAVEV